jgi:hypothetical protein
LLAASSLVFPGEENDMSEKYVQQRSGSKAVAIDNRAQIRKIRLLLLCSLLLSAGLAVVLNILFNH